MTKVWAHRGASGTAPENTLAAFTHAITLGADGVEFDVHLTADGEVVVIHDETVDRTTNGTGWVKDLSARQLSRLIAGVHDGMIQHVPTLAEVLTVLGPTAMDINIELKTDRIAQPDLIPAALAVVADHGLEDRVLWSSFHGPTLVALREQSSTARIGVLQRMTRIGPLPVRPMMWGLVEELDAEAMHPGHRELTRAVVEQAHGLGRRVHTWTLNDPRRARQLRAWGVDALMTDHVDRLRAPVAPQTLSQWRR